MMMRGVVVTAVVGLAPMEAVYGSAWVVQKVDKAGQGWIGVWLALLVVMFTAEIVLVHWAKPNPQHPHLKPAGVAAAAAIY